MHPWSNAGDPQLSGDSLCLSDETVGLRAVRGHSGVHGQLTTSLSGRLDSDTSWKHTSGCGYNAKKSSLGMGRVPKGWGHRQNVKENADSAPALASLRPDC